MKKILLILIILLLTPLIVSAGNVVNITVNQPLVSNVDKTTKEYLSYGSLLFGLFIVFGSFRSDGKIDNMVLGFVMIGLSVFVLEFLL